LDVDEVPAKEHHRCGVQDIKEQNNETSGDRRDLLRNDRRAAVGEVAAANRGAEGRGRSRESEGG
jgi:hypothetical protein